MYIKEFTQTNTYTRRSKSGKQHQYTRKKNIVLLRCDSCDGEFTRPRGKMNPNRLNNNYFHVCEHCDAKKFAQKKGVEKKQVWNLTASSELDISKL